MALFEAFLLEHNVVNKDAILQYCKEFADNCVNPNAKQWFMVTLAKYLAKDEEINAPMTAQTTPRIPPTWMKAAQERGDDLRVFEAPRNLDGVFDHLVDYFNHLNITDARLLSDPRRVLTVTVPVAIKKSEDWVKADAKAAAAEDHSASYKVVYRHGRTVGLKPPRSKLFTVTAKSSKIASVTEPTIRRSIQFRIRSSFSYMTKKVSPTSPSVIRLQHSKSKRSRESRTRHQWVAILR
jgi:hypothetical protein